MAAPHIASLRLRGRPDSGALSLSRLSSFLGQSASSLACFSGVPPLWERVIIRGVLISGLAAAGRRSGPVPPPAGRWVGRGPRGLVFNAAPEAAEPSSPLTSEGDDAGSGYAESEEEDDGEEDEVYFGRVIGRRPEGASHWLTPPLRAPNALQASPASFSAPDGGRNSPTGRRSRQGSPSVAQSTSGQQ